MNSVESMLFNICSSHFCRIFHRGMENYFRTSTPRMTDDKNERIGSCKTYLLLFHFLPHLLSLLSNWTFPEEIWSRTMVKNGRCRQQNFPTARLFDIEELAGKCRRWKCPDNQILSHAKHLQTNGKRLVHKSYRACHIFSIEWML